MPGALVEGFRPPLSNSTNSSSEHPRKSHDKTVGGVFAYTNGTDVETGLPEARLEQLKTAKNNSRSSLTNSLGPANGSVKGGPRDRAHSKAGSVSSINSGSGRQLEWSTTDPQKQPPLTPLTSPLTKLSNVENATEEYSNGQMQLPMRPVELEKTRTNSTPARYPTHDNASAPKATLSSSDSRSLQSDGGYLGVPSQGHGPLLNRFSSPAGTLNSSSAQEHRATTSTEMPRLAQRHTLSIPKAPPVRSSREFSFVGGPSEEVLTATGRFSPTRGEFDTPRHRRGSLGLIRRGTRSMHSDAHVDEIQPDEDATRWTDLTRQKLRTKRKRKEEEDDDRVIVGKKVEEGHANWVTAYNMLTGIRFTVSRTNAKIDRELTDTDFAARHKLSFDVTGTELTPSAKYDFKFKDYSPWVFRKLRARFGIDPADYLMSLTSKYILSELGSPGKSGSFFYFSRDYKYIIKTIHHAEHKLLRKILKDYYQHVLDNPNTLMSQFYGLHRVKIPYGKKIHFVIMNNLFPPHRDVHRMFDLKGSTVGRYFKETEGEDNPRVTLKDLNWLKKGLHIEFDNQIKQLFIEQLRHDVALLQRLHIMDYSLLVGMHNVRKGNDENLRQTTLQVFQPGGDGTGETAEERQNHLIRTPSRLETARKARELRLTLKKEKPMPLRNLLSAKFPDDVAPRDERRNRLFYGDDGGIRATHENGSKADEIYYLGVIDCLTHYGIIKRLEHFWKGLSNSRTQISPIPPFAYGERFINFVSGITMTQEEGERQQKEQQLQQQQNPSQQRGSRGYSVNSQNLPSQIPRIEAPVSEKTKRFSDLSQQQQPPRPPMSPPLSPTPASVDKTMRKAQKQLSREEDAANRSSKRSSIGDDSSVNDQTLTTAETTDRTTLPVIGEVGETSTSNSASGKNSRGKSPAGIRMVSQSTRGDGEVDGDGDEGDDVNGHADIDHEQTTEADSEFPEDLEALPDPELSGNHYTDTPDSYDDGEGQHKPEYRNGISSNGDADPSLLRNYTASPDDFETGTSVVLDIDGEKKRAARERQQYKRSTA